MTALDHRPDARPGDDHSDNGWRRHVPSRREMRDFASEVRRESQVRVPLELDPRSPLYRPDEMRSAVIAVGAVAATLLIGLAVGLIALLA